MGRDVVGQGIRVECSSLLKGGVQPVCGDEGGGHIEGLPKLAEVEAGSPAQRDWNVHGLVV